MLWILLTITAAPLQVARNVMQRGLVAEAGPWGATLVRFLFGLPFSIALLVLATWVTQGEQPRFTAAFWVAAGLGGAVQVGATAALLAAMGRSGFAVASMTQQASIPLAAIMGWVLGDVLGAQAWVGIVATTVGLCILSWPARTGGRAALTGAALGLTAALFFAMAANSHRQAALALEPAHPLYAAMVTLVAVQALQSLGLGALLAVRSPRALRAIVRSWRESLWAGVFGSAASACWFGAVALAPAGPVRAVGVIEAPIAAAAAHRLFREKLTARQWLGGGLAAIGVIMTALA